MRVSPAFLNSRIRFELWIIWILDGFRILVFGFRICYFFGAGSMARR
jgi:hypothetical protein